jgi:PAS domain-containing protein
MRLTMQIRSSERRLQQVVEATSDGFWDWDLRTGYVYRSARYSRSPAMRRKTIPTM